MSKSSRDSQKRQDFKEIRRRHWRAKAKDFATALVFSVENINRMKRGLPPRRLAILRNPQTGETIEYHAPIELHHIFPLNGDQPVEDQAFIECYPWQHAMVDESRKFTWQFVCWAGFQ